MTILLEANHQLETGGFELRLLLVPVHPKVQVAVLPQI